VAQEHVAALVVFGEMLMWPSAEIRERDRYDLVAMFEHAEAKAHVLSGLAVFCFKIPASLRFILSGPTIAHRALRHGEAAGLLVDCQGLPRRSIRARCAGEIALAHVAVGHVAVALTTQSHEQGHVGVATTVVLKIRNLAIEEELAQDDVAYRHGECGVGALLGMKPQVRQL